MTNMSNFYSVLRWIRRHKPDKRIRFVAVPDCAFPTNDISQISYSDNEICITQNLFSLAGQGAILPDYFTCLLLNSIENRQFAMRDFFDLFNDHLLNLYYTAWEKSRFYIVHENQTTGCTDFTTALLAGLAGFNKNQTDACCHDLFLRHCGILSHATRTTEGLSALIFNYFSLPNMIDEFSGEWLKVEHTELSRLSFRHSHNQLGMNCMLGGRIWLVQNGFTVNIGILSYSTFRDLFPNQPQLEHLNHIIQMHVGMEYFFHLVFKIDYATVPKLALKRNKFLLGWNTWLKTKLVSEKDKIVNVRFGIKNQTGSTLA